MASYLGLGLVLLAYIPSLFGIDYFGDDQALIQGIPGMALSKLWSTGYWQGAQGHTAPIQYYRPVLTTTFWLTGVSLLVGRLLNIALHTLGAALLQKNLRSRMSEEAAAAAALFWALNPVHVEAVAQLSGRSEVLSGACLLGAWLCLDGGRRLAGLGLFTAALLTKETAFFFPIFYALAGKKRKELIGLALCAAAVLGLRALVLDGLIEGGGSYFASRWTALRTIPKFWLQEYLVPALTGFGGCSDYSRPYFPDATSFFYILLFIPFTLSPFMVFLLPGSHLLMPIDTIGALRWLYLPLAGLAAALARWPALTVVLAAYLGLHTMVKANTYRTSEAFYSAAVSCNPGSARAWSSWAVPALERGDTAAGRQRLEKALSIQPNLPTPHYNLARLAYEERRLADAERHIRTSLALRPDADGYDLAGLILQKLGRDPRPDFEAARRLVPGRQ